ncbi:MAG: GNAT family N-acetyltransferase [Promethearchaeota archaeon]
MVDIVVDPEHQGCGLGRQIMEKIMEYIDINAPDGSYISNCRYSRIYQKFSFKRCAPECKGMFMKK